MSVARVTLPAGVRRAIVLHARREAPRECCGLLLGSKGIVSYAWPMRNTDRSPTRRFRIDARDHIEVRRWLRHVEPALGIVGAYHSHPNGMPTPSPSDLVEAHYPEWLWVIVGLAGGRARIAAYRIARKRARRLTLAAPTGHRPRARGRSAV